MRVVVAGSSGLIGKPLVRALRDRGDEVIELRRGTHEGRWDPATGRLDESVLDGADAVVSLAGESIGGRWTVAKKKLIRSSRIDGTRMLVQAMQAMEPLPSTFINASAMGFYGSRGSEQLTESSQPGVGFLAELSVDWERVASQAESTGVRVVLARTSLVLTRDGGSLKPLLRPFKLGLGGRIGSGEQFWSWITLDDEVRALLHSLDHPDVRGPVNLAAGAASNLEFTRALATAMHRPALFPLPAPVVRLLLGREFADEALLSSTRLVPEVLRKSGFEFKHRTLEEAFAAIL